MLPNETRYPGWDTETQRSLFKNQHDLNKAHILCNDLLVWEVCHSHTSQCEVFGNTVLSVQCFCNLQTILE
jgi:hypothetical protein